MPLKIHAVVQHPYNEDLFRRRRIENNMRLLPNPAQPRRELLGAAARVQIDAGDKAGWRSASYANPSQVYSLGVSLAVCYSFHC